jgi:hypothetical protein
MDAQKSSISIGCHVELNLLDLEGGRVRLSVDIVPDESADFQQGFLGLGTPLAKILVGEKSGTVIPYLKDDIYAIEILSVSASKVHPQEDIQKKRQANLARAIHEVEHTSAVVFASSFSGKWGDYDPESLPEEAPIDQKVDEDQTQKKPKGNRAD